MSGKLTVYRYRDASQPNTGWKVEGRAPDGSRVRRFFKTKSEAQAFADDRNAETASVGWKAMQMADDQRVEAAQCYELLAKTGKSLREVVDFYLEHWTQTERSATVAAVAEELLESKRRLNLSDRHLTNMKYHFKPVVEAFGARMISTVSRKELESWLHGRKLAPASFKSARTHLSMVFNHALRNGQVKENPMAHIQTPKAVSKPVEVLTPAAMRTLLVLARKHHPDMVPALAIQGFAGLRTEEVRRLDWRHVRLTEGYIEVTASNSKTAQRRLVEIRPNLMAQLAAMRRDSGPVVPKCYHVCHASLRRLMKVEKQPFPNNALRHSFASYHLAEGDDAAKTALQLGHMGPGMLFEHYRALVTRVDALAWWAITPESESGNVVRLGVSPAIDSAHGARRRVK